MNRLPVRLVVIAALLASSSLPRLSAKTTLSDAGLAEELQRIRDYHEPHLAIERESSVLGKLPDGAEAAATHVDLRKRYLGRPPEATECRGEGDRAAEVPRHNVLPESAIGSGDVPPGDVRRSAQGAQQRMRGHGHER